MSSSKPAKGRCGSPLRGKPGEFCTQYPLPGVTRCGKHGGKSPQVQTRRNKEVARRGLHRMVTAIEPTDIDANPLIALDTEFRKTVATIRYLDEVITELLEQCEVGKGGEVIDPETITLWDEAAPLFYGLYERKEVTSGEWPGVDTTYRAGLNAVEEKRQWERKHLVEMTKLWIESKMDERKAAMNSRIVDTVDTLLTTVLLGLHHDPRDKDVRKVVTDAFATIVGPAAALALDGTTP